MASMVAAWPTVALGEVARPVGRPETPIAGKSYGQAGVRLWGQGVYEREPVDGGATQYKTLSRIEADDIIINKIWARNGSVSVVTPELAGAYVSGEFPTFEVMRDRLLPQWFFWLTKTRPFWEQCDELSRGTSGKNRIQPEKFLRVRFPLPPLDEQRRIVARIEALARRIAEARGLRQAALAEAEALWRSALGCAFAAGANVESVPLEFVCSAIIDNLHSDPVYADSGVPCVRSSDVGWGTLHLETARRTSEEEYQRRTIRGEPIPGDIVLVREGGGTGKAALVAEGQRFSLGQRVMMLRPDFQRVLPQFLLYQMLSPTIYDGHIVPLSKGSASPHLNIGALRRFSVQLPSLSRQTEIVLGLDVIRQQADALRQVQEAVSVELDALLPSVLDRAFRGEL